VYTVAVSGLPGGRGDGVPVTSLIDLEPGTQPVHYLAGPAESTWLLANSGGYGLLARIGDMAGRQRGGKAFLSLEDGERLLPPAPVLPSHRHVACLAQDGRLLVYGLDELKLQANGGRGLTLMDVDAACPLISVAAVVDSVTVQGQGRGGKAKEERLGTGALAAYLGKRARKGRKIEGFVKPMKVV
jgi:topoisomerase-4 subunit A